MSVDDNVSGLCAARLFKKNEQFKAEVRVAQNPCYKHTTKEMNLKEEITSIINMVSFRTLSTDEAIEDLILLFNSANESQLKIKTQYEENMENISIALKKLENLQTIQNGEVYFVAYKKVGDNYFKFTSEDETLIPVSLRNIKNHVEQYTLETNHYFF